MLRRSSDGPHPNPPLSGEGVLDPTPTLPSAGREFWTPPQPSPQRGGRVLLPGLHLIYTAQLKHIERSFSRQQGLRSISQQLRPSLNPRQLIYKLAGHPRATTHRFAISLTFFAPRPSAGAPGKSEPRAITVDASCRQAPLFACALVSIHGRVSSGKQRSRILRVGRI